MKVVSEWGLLHGLIRVMICFSSIFLKINIEMVYSYFIDGNLLSIKTDTMFKLFKV